MQLFPLLKAPCEGLFGLPQATGLTTRKKWTIIWVSVWINQWLSVKGYLGSVGLAKPVFENVCQRVTVTYESGVRWHSLGYTWGFAGRLPAALGRMHPYALIIENQLCVLLLKKKEEMSSWYLAYSFYNKKKWFFPGLWMCYNTSVLSCGSWSV